MCHSQHIELASPKESEIKNMQELQNHRFATLTNVALKVLFFHQKRKKAISCEREQQNFPFGNP